MKIIKQDKAKGFLGDLLDNMDNRTLSRAEKRMGITIKKKNMNLTKKLNKLFSVKEVKDVEGAEVWMMTWLTYTNTCLSNKTYRSLVKTDTKAKAFLNEEDAKLYAQSLRDANELLQNGLQLDIEITKQK